MEATPPTKTDLDDAYQIFCEQIKHTPCTRQLFEQGCQFLVCKQDGEVIGFASFMFNGFEVEILHVATKPGFERRGVATKLLKCIFEKYSGLTVFLEVEQDNTAAISLYEKLGFEKIFVRNNYYSNGGAAIIMKK